MSSNATAAHSDESLGEVDRFAEVVSWGVMLFSLLFVLLLVFVCAEKTNHKFEIVQDRYTTAWWSAIIFIGYPCSHNSVEMRTVRGNKHCWLSSIFADAHFNLYLRL